MDHDLEYLPKLYQALVNYLYETGATGASFHPEIVDQWNLSSVLD